MNFQVGDKVRVKKMQELAALYGKPIQGVCGATVVVPGGKPTCGRYVSPEDYGGECSIEGMVKYFEGQKNG